MTINGIKQFIELGLRPDGISVNKIVETGGQQLQSPPGAATVTDTGATSTATPPDKVRLRPTSLHVVGDTTCGTPVG